MILGDHRLYFRQEQLLGLVVQADSIAVPFGVCCGSVHTNHLCPKKNLIRVFGWADGFKELHSVSRILGVHMPARGAASGSRASRVPDSTLVT